MFLPEPVPGSEEQEVMVVQAVSPQKWALPAAQAAQVEQAARAVVSPFPLLI